MATWHRVGDEAELRHRAPLAVETERHRIAIFHHDGKFRAISDIRNHRRRPLSEERVGGEFAMYAWHSWEYSVVTCKAPAGYDEEQEPVSRLESHAGCLHLNT
jgi:phenylpropionate dioxygenase-like ring-hydroxylating dioxygenase large terminal subunit